MPLFLGSTPMAIRRTLQSVVSAAKTRKLMKIRASPECHWRGGEIESSQWRC
jgi:hypothetical protein